MKQNEFDAYDISKQIFDLWQTHANRMSGQINKGFMAVPISVCVDGTYAHIANVSFDETRGVVIDIEN